MNYDLISFYINFIVIINAITCDTNEPNLNLFEIKYQLARIIYRAHLLFSIQ